MSNLDIDPVSLTLLRLIVVVELALGERDPATFLYRKHTSPDSENTPHSDPLVFDNCEFDECGLVFRPSDPFPATPQQTSEIPLAPAGVS